MFYSKKILHHSTSIRAESFDSAQGERGDQCLSKILTLLFILLLPILSFAYEHKLIIPQKSLLQLSTMNTDNAPEAHFKGSIWVSGTLVKEVYNSDAQILPSYLLIPDSTSLKQLPYFKNYPVTWIYIDKGAAETFEKLAAIKKPVIITEDDLKSFKVKGNFKINHYSVGAECDSPWARARIIDQKLSTPQTALLAVPPRC